MRRNAFVFIRLTHQRVSEERKYLSLRRIHASALITCFCLLILTLYGTVKAFADEKPELVLQSGHTASVAAVAFSPGDRILASAGGDNTIKLWEVATGREIRSLSGHTAGVNAIAFSPGGNTLASGSYDHTVRLWDVKTGRELRRFLGHTGQVYAVAFSPDGRLLASGSGWYQDHTIRLWDTLTGRETRTFKGHSDEVSSVAFSPDGRILASASSDTTIKLWDVQTGKPLFTLIGHSKYVRSLDFSPDGRFLVSGSGDNSVKIWEVAKGRELQTLTGHSRQVNAVAYSPDGKWLVSGSHDRKIKLWELATGREVRTLAGHTNEVMALACSTDGRWIASGSVDTTVKLWQVATGLQFRTFLGHTSAVNTLSISPDGYRLASGSGWMDNCVRLWNIGTGHELITLTGHKNVIKSIVFSPDGRRLATGSEDHTIKVWDVGTGRDLQTLSGHTDSVYGVTFSPDGRRLASASRDNTIKLWEIAAGKELYTLTGHKMHVMCIAFSPDGRSLATGGYEDNTIKLWDANTGQELRTLSGHTGAIPAVVFSPDGRWLASGSWDRSIKVWEVTTGREFRTLAGHGGVVLTLAFSRDGLSLASAGADLPIKIWDLTTGRELRALTGHVGSINSLVFSVDGRYLVSGSGDGSIRFWNYRTGVELVLLSALRQSPGWISFSPEGFFDGTRTAWQLVPFRFPSEPLRLYEPEQFFNQFYQPGLLADIFREGKPIREILKDQKDPRANLDISKYRDSKLPEVKIISPQDGFKTGEREIQITIEAKDTGSGIRDLRVFRNQNLAHFEHGDLNPHNQTKTCRLAVPVKVVAGPNEISAYAFNRDNVKSKDARIRMVGAENLKRKGTAYIFAVGVNEYSNPDWNLNFAVNDAKGIREMLAQSFKKLNTYSQTVPVALLDGEAMKANLITAFKLLSGAITSFPAEAPEVLKKLRRAEPEDDIIVYFSGHGMADQDRYYLIPHDMGYQGRRVDLDKAGRKLIMKHSLSDKGLNIGFEKIDAGRMMLIIDACQSGQALESEEKRRGPMNSRGLAQLAYEKGMYILAAAQSHQSALELEKLGHGILTYTLLEEGLKNLAADNSPQDNQINAEEWLDYATQHVGREFEMAKAQYAKRKGGEEIDGGEITVTGQSPRAYYRRERVGDAWVLLRQ